MPRGAGYDIVGGVYNSLQVTVPKYLKHNIYTPRNDISFMLLGRYIGNI